MKVINGKLSLDKRDRRVGNFVYTVEKNHIKVCDINSMVSHRVSLGIARGRLLEMLVRGEDGESSERILETYATCMFNVLGVPFDGDYLLAINKAASEALERHKDLYRQRSDDEGADDDALEAVRAVEDIRSAVEVEKRKEAQS